jgi:hypothetical protein
MTRRGGEAILSADVSSVIVRSSEGKNDWTGLPVLPTNDRARAPRFAPCENNRNAYQISERERENSRRFGKFRDALARKTAKSAAFRRTLMRFGAVLRSFLSRLRENGSRMPEKVPPWRKTCRRCQKNSRDLREIRKPLPDASREYKNNS